MITTLEKTRHCCKNPKFFLILFDGAGTADLPILVCEVCSQKPLFQKFVKIKVSINSNLDIKEILNSF
jgi:hypothetical protein